VIGDQRQHDGGLLVGIEVGPVQCHHDGAACADDVGHPAGEDVVDPDVRIGEQAVDLFGGMLGVQASGGGKAPADGADRERGATQHANGGVAERVDALGVKVMVQHAAKDSPDRGEGQALLPDDHDIPRHSIANREIGWAGWDGKPRSANCKDVSPATLSRFFPESLLCPPDSFMSWAK
jgi:hypothetical protein